MSNFASDLEEIAADPHKFGAPTFEEFRQNPGKYLRHHEKTYATVEDSKTAFQGLITKQRYFFRSSTGKKFKCKTLDAVWKVAQSEGVSPIDVDYDPQIVPQGNGQCEVHVTFFRKPVIPGFMMNR